MKDKLRELAERWKGEIPSQHDEYLATMCSTRHDCARAILSILDTEGDGGAVDTGNLVDDPLYLALDALYERGWNDSEKHKHDARGTNEWQRVLDLFLATHPARSGVVSDEDVRDAERYRWLRARCTDDLCVRKGIAQITGQALNETIDAAIQGERHER